MSARRHTHSVTQPPEVTCAHPEHRRPPPECPDCHTMTHADREDTVALCRVHASVDLSLSIHTYDAIWTAVSYIRVTSKPMAEAERALRAAARALLGGAAEALDIPWDADARGELAIRDAIAHRLGLGADGDLKYTRDMKPDL